MSEIYIGLMSGTSLDGIDGVLMDFSGTKVAVLQHSYCRFTPELTHEFLSLNTSGGDELHRAALAANALVRAYAGVVADLLATSGTDRSKVAAIGAHGQTVRHRPQEFGTGYTLQLNNPALLAELTGIDVVADFRSRDVAAGGQGAPLVPAFHQAVFGRADQTVAVLNIGGISNISVLGPGFDAAHGDVIGFDCGPGNALLDHWCHKHTGQAFDNGGRWAAGGHVNDVLLKILLDEPYFSKPPPKSTGRDLFNVEWLATKLAAFDAIDSWERVDSHDVARPAMPENRGVPVHTAIRPTISKTLSPVDVQTTLTELTAMTCAAAVSRYGKSSKSLIVCGGGAFNTYLMERIQAQLPGFSVVSSQERGLPPMQVEAAAFAWLAAKTVKRETANLPKVTGAKGTRILGAIYPA